MSIFKNVFKQAPHLISNLFAGAVTVLAAIVTFGTDAAQAFSDANCSECVTISSKAVAIATIGLGVAKVFGVKVAKPALEDAPLEIPVEPASEPVPVEPASEPVPVEPASEPVPVEPAPEPVPVEPAPEPVPVEPAPEPIPVEPAPEPVPVEPAPEPIEVDAIPEPAPIEPAPKAKRRARKSK